MQCAVLFRPFQLVGWAVFNINLSLTLKFTVQTISVTTENMKELYCSLLPLFLCICLCLSLSFSLFFSLSLSHTHTLSFCMNLLLFSFPHLLGKTQKKLLNQWPGIQALPPPLKLNGHRDFFLLLFLSLKF